MVENNGNIGEKVSWGRVLTFSGAIVAYLIGSGFATGQEILQFYAAFGLWQSVAAFCTSMFLFCWLGRRIMADGKKLQLQQPSEIFEYYCGKYLGKFYEIFTAVFLYMIFVVMISGSGAIMHEYYGVSRYVGCFAMALVSMITVLLGLDSIVNVIGRIGPVIITVALLLGFSNIVKNSDGLWRADEVLAGVTVMKAASHWFLSGVLYVAFCSIVMVPFLAGMGAKAENCREAMLGGSFGGFFFTLGAAAIGLGMLASIDKVYNLQAPALAVADVVYPGLGIFYSVIVVLGIYTTAVPMLWTPCKTINPDEKSKAFRVAAVIGTVVAFFGGQLHFSTLVNIIYPYSGYLGMLLVTCIVSKRLRKGTVHTVSKPSGGI